LNYFISYYDRSAAKWRLWFDRKERAQDRECLRCKHKENEYKHCCEFHARRFYQNQSPSQGKFFAISVINGADPPNDAGKGSTSLHF